MWRDKTRTSAYIGQIQLAFRNPVTLDHFKSLRAYRAIIGFPSIQQTMAFVKQALSDKEIAKNIDEFIKADTIGHPTTYKIWDKWISNNTGRYLNSIQLMKKEFGSLDGFKILEIGAGWGGLMHCIKTQWKPASYNIMDLEEAMALAEWHSNQLGHTFTKGEPTEEMDLAIAEYSITEFDEKSLMDYTTSYLLPAKRVFVRCNIVVPEVKRRWLDTMKENFSLKVYQEDPDEIRFNCIVVGKQ